MHTYTQFLLGLLFAGMVLFAPSMLRADIIAPDPEPYTFENQQKLILNAETSGEQLKETILSAGSTRDVHYSLWFNEAFLRDYGEITPGHEADVLQTALDDKRLFLELWRGAPFTSEAVVVDQRELPPALNGNVTLTFPEAGQYFLVAYMTNEVRDEAAYCARYGVPQEFCEEDGYFTHFTPEDTQRYFKGDFEDDVGLHDSNPTAFGGTRLTVGPPLGNVSNVLFLPGIKGTRLYRPGAACAGPVQSCARKLWEPFGNDEVRQLYLDEAGRSVNGDVYVRTGDVLSKVILEDLYTGFFDDLDTAESDRSFGAGWRWEAAAYDWRLSLDDIVSRGARYDDRIYYEEANGMPYIERLLRDLAASSSTGKVTIVAHSNGGLVAKALMQRLGDAETAALIDKVVLVAVPQSGAPRALGAALFGHGEALPFDSCSDTSLARWLCTLLVDRPTARTFAEHSPMTYHLLPSRAYFNSVNDHEHLLATFSGSHFYRSEQSRYGSSLNHADELRDFVLAIDGGRTKPAASDTGSANVLSESLMAYARAIHDRIDAWVPPAGVEAYEVAGWGNDTIGGIEFYEEPRLIGSSIPRYRPVFINDGDGTVPVASAQMMPETGGVKRYWANLRIANRDHATLFEEHNVRDFLRNIILGHPDELPALITETEPVTSQPEKKLMFFLHSPLSLALYDRYGSYTGTLRDRIPMRDVTRTDYGEFGDVKYVIATADEQLMPYTIVLNGLANGTFSLDIQEREGNEVTAYGTISEVPTTAATIATLTVSAGNVYSALDVDEDGDGTVDFSIVPHLTFVKKDGMPDDEPLPPPDDSEPDPNPEPSDPPSDPPPDPEPDPDPEPPVMPPRSDPVSPAPSNGSGSGGGTSTKRARAERPIGNDTEHTERDSLTSTRQPELVAYVAGADSGAASSSDTGLATTSVLAADTFADTAVPPRTLTASAYDAFRSSLGTIPLAKLWLLLFVLLLFLLMLALRKRRDSERKDESD